MRTAIKIIVRLDQRNRGFRFYAFTRGKVLGIHGSITYYGDNQDIVIHAEAKDSVLQHYISILRLGTPFSKVICVMSAPDRMLNSNCFEISPNSIPLNGTRLKEPSAIRFMIGLLGF